MVIDLAGKPALVTGGASGIGREIALVLAEAGAHVIVADIDLEGAQKTVHKIGAVLAVKCDLGNPADIAAMHKRVSSEMGPIEILVNCGGIISYKPSIRAVELDEWDKVLDVNLRGTHLVCREFIEEMKELKSGKIVNVSSLAARIGSIEVGIHYTASKAGLIGFTKTLAKEVGPYSINVNAVAPGIIATEPVKQQIAGHEDEYSTQIPLRRLGQPRDVANVVLFLVCPQSDYITGIVLDVNGGLYMGG
ncbi:SDR family NAD(P)-dependent oxidoreductase [Planctomycetota bacterium]